MRRTASCRSATPCAVMALMLPGVGYGRPAFWVPVHQWLAPTLREAPGNRRRCGTRTSRFGPSSAPGSRRRARRRCPGGCPAAWIQTCVACSPTRLVLPNVDILSCRPLIGAFYRTFDAFKAATTSRSGIVCNFRTVNDAQARAWRAALIRTIAPSLRLDAGVAPAGRRRAQSDDGPSDERCLCRTVAVPQSHSTASSERPTERR
jgi:hypothetical protein